ncbi:cobalamin biosynthesis protein [Intestinimonas butyriciproducens]|uniref:cobalamin biosynthesis protein n=1 Tax=Intestinimonas butyriciproducens TaxID=1297617 RepID=UPI00195973C9|nr:cobalamin biosynthesis protein [Intestinimonas butyriciproducens]
MNIALTAFTSRGAELAGRLAKALTEDGHSCALWVPERLAPETGLPGYRSLGPWTGERFADSDALLFVGASGIAVRAIAPYVRDKFTDPAVVSVDETGRFAVPLLSGHVGGANDLARLVARRTGGTAAVSTATDVNGRFAVDQWAREQGFFLDGREGAKRVSAALLAGISVGMESDFPIQGPLPQGVVEGPAEAGIALTLDPEKRPFPHTVRLIPPVLHLGIGCRRGTPAATIAKAVEGVFRSRHLSLKGVAAVCSIDLKKDEAGLLAFCQGLGLPLTTYSAGELSAVPGDFTPSPFVHGVAGVDNVCERAAVRRGGSLIVPKQAGEGVTVAVSQVPLTIRFSKKGD